MSHLFLLNPPYIFLSPELKGDTFKFELHLVVETHMCYLVRMPARNTIKQYMPNGYYHIYNRGVEKRKIFLDQQDYNVFLSYLKDYLLPKDTEGLQSQLADPTLSWSEKAKVLKLLRLNNFADEINLLAFALMPNHFHFLIRQKSHDAIDRFIQSLGTRYTMYFNKRYKRIGPLYQDVYKAVSVLDEQYYLHLSRYIHRQALRIPSDDSTKPVVELQPTSYFDYLGKRNTPWVQPHEILSYFSETNPHLSYEDFVLQNEHDIPDISFPSLTD